MTYFPNLPYRLFFLLTMATGLLFTPIAHTQNKNVNSEKDHSFFEEEIKLAHYTQRPSVEAFIDDMVGRYDFDKNALRTLFNKVSYSSTAVRLITPSATTTPKNWRAYRHRFIEPIRINGGVRFWQKNLNALNRASSTYGVPPEIIVAIIGIETLYGQHMGNFRALDVLTTLAFDYPNTNNRVQRQNLFRQNLESFLVWTRDENIDPSSVLSSYAGAIGIPQFMPTSLIKYAVNFDNAPTINLRNSPTDAIGSVGNFLKLHGWESGRPIVWKITPDEGSEGIARAAHDGSPELNWTLGQLLDAGMVINEQTINMEVERNTRVTIVDLPTPNQNTQFVLGLKNFYTLTRYNRSFFYAMAVYELSEALKKQYAATTMSNNTY